MCGGMYSLCSPWSLLTGIQGGKKKNVWSPLGCIIDEDPASFASISGKLDAVAGLCKEAIVVKDLDLNLDLIKKVYLYFNCRSYPNFLIQEQNMKKTVGEGMCMGLMKGHAHKHVISASVEMEGDGDGSDKENSGVSKGLSSELGSRAAN